MRKSRFASFLVCTAMLAFGAAACGGGDDPDPMIVDAAPTSDGGTATPDSSTPGTVADFGECNSTADCASTNADCVPIYGGQLGKQCLPKCAATTECPLDTFCYPQEGLPGQLGPMAGHCWLSICGGQFENGTTGGSCTVGGEWPSTPASDTRAGWCQPIADDPMGFGICVEVGTVAPGGTCDVNRSRTANMCDAQGFCVPSSPSSPTGTCNRYCDPNTILTRTEGNSGCDAGQDCYDASSNVKYEDGTRATATLAVCLGDITACALVPPNNACPAAADGAAQGCFPTNSVRPTGVCDPLATGALQAGATCPQLAQTTPEDMRCTAGTICNGQTASSLTCQTYCDIPAAGGTPQIACASGTTCTELLWGAGYDETVGTTDDEFTLGWGTCQ